MAVGNTFGATALSSYGGFWIAYGILLTPNWNIIGKGGPYEDPAMAQSALAFFLTGWFIFTTILLLCTLRSTIMFFMLFFTLDLCFLMLACGTYATSTGAMDTSHMLHMAGGGFGMLAAFLAWYNAFAGIADSRFVPLPSCPGGHQVLTFVPATPSSSSPSSTSPGPRRGARTASTTSRSATRLRTGTGHERSYDDDNNNRKRKRIGRARHPPTRIARLGLDPAGGVVYAFTTWVWFSFGLGFIEWHMSRYLCQALSAFLEQEKKRLYFSRSFFGNYFEYLLKHWSGQTWESRYISLPASIKCKPDSHNQRPDSPNEHFSLWSPKPMLYFIKLGGAHPPPSSFLPPVLPRKRERRGAT